MVPGLSFAAIGYTPGTGGNPVVRLQPGLGRAPGVSRTRGEPRRARGSRPDPADGRDDTGRSMTSPTTKYWPAMLQAPYCALVQTTAQECIADPIPQSE